MTGRTREATFCGRVLKWQRRCVYVCRIVLGDCIWCFDSFQSSCVYSKAPFQLLQLKTEASKSKTDGKKKTIGEPCVSRVLGLKIESAHEPGWNTKPHVFYVGCRRLTFPFRSAPSALITTCSVDFIPAACGWKQRTVKASITATTEGISRTEAKSYGICDSAFPSSTLLDDSQSLSRVGPI